MPGSRPLSSRLLLGVVVAAFGCSDLPTAPGVPDPLVRAANTVAALQPSLDLAGGLVSVLKWVEPLESDEVVTEVIGPDGGKIELKNAGFKLHVPKGALDHEVPITVTAVAGELVGFEFQPHGLEFDLPVKAQQKQQKLALPRGQKKGNIFAAYYEGPLLSQVEAREILGIEVTEASQSFLIWHFSGYVIATD